MKLQKCKIKSLHDNKLSPLAANNILFPALDQRRYVPVDIADKDHERRINVHPDCIFFATANLGVEYSGTHAVDRALLDRFFPIEMDYPSKELEAKVLIKRTNIDAKSAKAIATLAENIRQSNKKEDLSTAVSVRHTLQAASLVVDGMSLVKALESTFLPLFEKGETANSERGKVRSMITAH